MSQLRQVCALFACFKSSTRAMIESEHHLRKRNLHKSWAKHMSHNLCYHAVTCHHWLVDCLFYTAAWTSPICHLADKDNACTFGGNLQTDRNIKFQICRFNSNRGWDPFWMSYYPNPHLPEMVLEQGHKYITKQSQTIFIGFLLYMPTDAFGGICTA